MRAFSDKPNQASSDTGPASEMKSGALRLVYTTQLKSLCEQAARSPRQRSHLLLHAGPNDQVQRLLIAAQPGTYVRPHRHPQQWEMLVLQSGRADILIFDETGRLLRRANLDRATPIAEIPMAEWHGCVVREPDTVIMEIKPGPYQANEFAQWAREEGHPEAASFVQWATGAGIGARWEPPRAGNARPHPPRN